jgi:hypothetical protein
MSRFNPEKAVIDGAMLYICLPICARTTSPYCIATATYEVFHFVHLHYFVRKRNVAHRTTLQIGGYL